MSKAVMLSIQPKWCELIASGEKTIEVRKSHPSIETPFKCYIYCTKHKYYHLYDLRKISNGTLNFSVVEHNKTSLVADGFLNGKVIGEFVCDWIKEIDPHCDIPEQVNQYIHHYPAIIGDDCLTFQEMKEYLGNRTGYDWHISDLVIYDTPKGLGEFFVKGECENFDNCRFCPYFHEGRGWLDGNTFDEDDCEVYGF